MGDTLYTMLKTFGVSSFKGKTSLYFCHGLSAKIVYTGSVGTIMIKIRGKGPTSQFV